MKLDKTLNFKKVRCVKGYEDCLKIGKEYSVLNIRIGVEVRDDEGSKYYWRSVHFEPIIESAENPLQNIELTPEFEVAEPVLVDNCQVNIQDIGTDILDTNADTKNAPKFKVGDRVYCAGFSVLFKVLKVENTNGVLLEHCAFVGGMYADAKYVCHATPENYERLQATFPDIEFERPTKELTGSDLCFKKLREGKVFIVCAISDLSDEKAIKRLQDGDNCIRIIKDCDPAPYHFIDVHGIRHGFAVPLNDETGEPLTESVLDE